MSLGPPFDDADSSDRLRLGLGIGAAALLLFFAGFAILASERSLGDSLTIHVDVTRIGTLNTGFCSGWALNNHVKLIGMFSPTNTARAGRASSTFISVVLGMASTLPDAACAVACLLPCVTVIEGTSNRPSLVASICQVNTHRTSLHARRRPFTISSR